MATLRAVIEAARFMGFIPVSHLAKARSFYSDVLGLRVREENPFAVSLDSGDTTIRLTQVEDLQPQNFTIAGWVVPDLHVAIDALVGRGVTFTRYGGMNQDERGIWTTPNGDQVAWFKDPDGNTLSLTTFAE